MAIRPVPLVKEFLFIGHPEAGERSAVIYTLLGSCGGTDQSVRLLRIDHACQQSRSIKRVHTIRMGQSERESVRPAA